MKRYNILLDTDIGPDCDDCAAIAILLTLHKAGLCRLACMTNCTTNPYGAPCADALAKYSGVDKIPVGEYKSEKPFLDDCRAYNRYIAENFDCRYKPGTGARAPDAVKVLREALASSDDASCVICTIGQFTNAALLLASGPDEISPLTGRELIEKKSVRLVSMAGYEKPGTPEYNVECDIPSAKTALGGWPTEVWLSPWETGGDVITGTEWFGVAENHPLRIAFRLYTKSDTSGRSSWDPTAALAAALGTAGLFSLSEPGRFTVNDDGSDSFAPDAAGNFRYLRKARPAKEIASVLDRLMGGDEALARGLSPDEPENFGRTEAK